MNFAGNAWLIKDGADYYLNDELVKPYNKEIEAQANENHGYEVYAEVDNGFLVCIDEPEHEAEEEDIIPADSFKSLGLRQADFY